MSERSGPAEEWVVHKAARECPMIEPHRWAICGIVKARQLARERADAERRASSGGL